MFMTHKMKRIIILNFYISASFLSLKMNLILHSVAMWDSFKNLPSYLALRLSLNIFVGGLPDGSLLCQQSCNI